MPRYGCMTHLYVHVFGVCRLTYSKNERFVRVLFRCLGGKSKIFHLSGKIWKGKNRESADLNLFKMLAVVVYEDWAMCTNNSFRYFSFRKKRHETTVTHSHTNRCGKIVSTVHKRQAYVLLTTSETNKRETSNDTKYTTKKKLSGGLAIVRRIHTDTVAAILWIVSALCMFQTGCRIPYGMLTLTLRGERSKPRKKKKNRKYKGEEELVQFSEYTAQQTKCT